MSGWNLMTQISIHDHYTHDVALTHHYKILYKRSDSGKNREMSLQAVI